MACVSLPTPLQSEMYESRIVTAVAFSATQRFCPSSESPCTYRWLSTKSRGTLASVFWALEPSPIWMMSP